MTDISRLANELWMEIFESITYVSDISSVSRTCRKFNILASRALARRISWKDPRHLAANLRFWELNSALVNSPRSLTVSLSAVRPSIPGETRYNTTVVHIDGTLHPVYHAAPTVGPGQIMAHFLANPSGSRHHPRYVASWNLYNSMTNLVRSFISLEELTFRKAFLSSSLYSIIHSLPKLRSLVIDSCTLPSVIATDMDHSVLPITELTLRNLEGNIGDWPQSNLFQMLSLCTARNLRYLHVDYRANVFQIFTQSSHGFVPYGIPAHLEHLEVRMPIQSQWPSDAHQAYSLLIQPLAVFLERCPSITDLSIYNYMPNFSLHSTALPNLRSYKGPLTTIVSVSGSRAVEALDVSTSGKTIAELTGTLGQVAERHSDLKTICVIIDRWDDEILYAITQLFPHLSRLKIVYNYGAPTEDTILGLGARFLYRLPNLSDVAIFNPMLHSADKLINSTPQPLLDFNGQAIFVEDWELGDLYEHEDPEQLLAHERGRRVLSPLPPADAEEGLRELVMAWRRYCPNLREIQLAPGFIWRRAHDGDEWCKRKFEWLDGRKNFIL